MTRAPELYMIDFVDGEGNEIHHIYSRRLGKADDCKTLPTTRHMELNSSTQARINELLILPTAGGSRKTLAQEGDGAKRSAPRPDKAARQTPADTRSGLADGDLEALHWAQMFRVAARCNYWYNDALTDGPGNKPLREDDHRAMVLCELGTLRDRMEKVDHGREEFLGMLLDALSKTCEGPLGLGTTSKKEFEEMMVQMVIRAKVYIKTDDFRYFPALRMLHMTAEDKEERQRRSEQQQQQMKAQRQKVQAARKKSVPVAKGKAVAAERSGKAKETGMSKRATIKMDKD